MFLVNCLHTVWKWQEASLQKPSFGNHSMKIESTFASGNTGKKTVSNSCSQRERESSPFQISVYCQSWMLTGFTISVTFTRSCMSYAAIHCSHATHIASCCSPLLARQGAYLWNAMSPLGFNIGMNGRSLDGCKSASKSGSSVFACVSL